MPQATARVCVPLVCLLLGPALARAAEQQDRYEDQAVARCVEKVVKADKTERGHWIRELEAVFPDRVVHAVTEDEYATWYDLLAGKNPDWRRDDAPSPAVAELYDRVVQKFELGPVPSLKRDEFMKYVKRLMRDNPQPAANCPNPPPTLADEADKVFRVLDRDGDGELVVEEFTTSLREDKLKADADGNGRLTKEEYRDHFQRKVTAKGEMVLAAAKAGGDPLARGPDGKAAAGKGRTANGLPEWFTTLDTDKDGQIALFEWRRSGRPIALYTEMDLNGDGLLTRDEYLRYVKLNEEKLKQEKREMDK